jgi:hypothetical protein
MEVQYEALGKARQEKLKSVQVRRKETLGFGSETWTLTKHKKTGSSINTVPCTTYGCYRDKLHVEVIKDQMRKISIVKHTEKRKLRWVEQFERMARKVMTTCRFTGVLICP